MPDGVLHVAKGGTATVQVRASGVVPEIARLRIRGESSFRARTAIMDRLGDDVFSTDLPDVTESAGLTVRAGDGRLEGGRLVAVERPGVASARMVVRPPDYISAEPAELLPAMIERYIELKVRGRL